MTGVSIRTLSAATMLVLAWAVPARAADPAAEVGTSLAAFMSQRAHDTTVNAIFVPGSPATLMSGTGAGVYASVFLNKRFAVEPRIGYAYASVEGDTSYMIGVSGLASYFLAPANRRAPFAFGGVGFVGQTGEDTVPTYTAGMGYRIPIGDTLAVRVDGRYEGVKYTLAGKDDWHHSVVITFSIGGIFARK